MIDPNEDAFYDAYFYTPAELAMVENRSLDSVEKDIASGKLKTFIGENGETYILEP